MRPKTRRVATTDIIRALSRIVIHIGVKYPDVLEDHADDLKLVEASASGEPPKEREPSLFSGVSDEGGEP